MGTNTMKNVSAKTIGRLSVYRRVLHGLLAEDRQTIFSHELAVLVAGKAAQVRRDVMAVGYTGSTTRGYDVRELMRSIGRFLDAPDGQGMALVGVGLLGRAVLAYFSGSRLKLSIEATFDIDASKVNRVIQGCRCYPLKDLSRIIKKSKISLGIITVPADQAQGVAEKLCRAGVSGLLNFAPVRLQVAPDVHVENVDIITAFEQAAFFARARPRKKARGR